MEFENGSPVALLPFSLVPENRDFPDLDRQEGEMIL